VILVGLGLFGTRYNIYFEHCPVCVDVILFETLCSVVVYVCMYVCCWVLLHSFIQLIWETYCVSASTQTRIHIHIQLVSSFRILFQFNDLHCNNCDCWWSPHADAARSLSPKISTTGMYGPLQLYIIDHNREHLCISLLNSNGFSSSLSLLSIATNAT